MNAHQTILMSHLCERREKNPRFSLRAFARFLEISPAHLSSLINGRKRLTYKQAIKISEKLDLTETENEALMQDLTMNFKGPPFLVPELRILEDDEFKVISDWQHLAILSLGELQNNKADARWIADQLAIDQGLAFESFHRLQQLGFLAVKEGKFKQSTKPLNTIADVPSRAIRSYHRQNLRLAEEKLDSVPVQDREFSTITMAVNPKKLARAKKMINEFKQKLSAELETGEVSEVYTMAIQLFPLTKVRSSS